MNSRSPTEPKVALTLEDVVERLSLTLGTEKGRELVTTAAAAARTFEAGAVLRELQGRPGLVGLTARRLLSQIEPQREEAPPPKVTTFQPRPAPPQRATEEDERSVGTLTIVGLLSHSLGDQTSAALVDSAKRKVGVDGEVLTLTAALRVLEVLCAEPGLTGVSARFAKARILLGAKGSP